MHAAYGVYTPLGVRYTAATQDDEATRARLAGGHALVACDPSGTLVGTVTYYGRPTPRDAAAVSWYHGADVGNFGQFAVAPGLQRGGIGTALLDAIARHARDDGKTELACETAAPNETLVAYYVRRGFRVVDTFTWPGDDVVCVVLSRRLHDRDRPAGGADDA